MWTARFNYVHNYVTRYDDCDVLLQSTVSLTAYQYECQSVNVKVVNTYRTAGNFKVTFYEMDDKTFTNSLSAKSRKRLNSSTTARVPSFVLLGSELEIIMRSTLI